jgi:hypothetical protein
LSDLRVGIGEYDVTRHDEPQVVVGKVAASVALGLGRPDVTATDLLPVCLFVIYPPDPHAGAVQTSSVAGDVNFKQHML